MSKFNRDDPKIIAALARFKLIMKNASFEVQFHEMKKLCQDIPEFKFTEEFVLWIEDNVDQIEPKVE